MATIEDLTWRGLTDADIDRAVALNVEAGWNQTASDWRFMLSQGEGTGVVDKELIATSMLLPQGGPFAWIAMILVTGKWQRRGLASELMRRCISRSEDLGLTAGLDATEAGRQVYLPLGFQDIYSLTRWQADAAMVEREGAARPMTENDLARISAFDRKVSGAARQGLLAHLFGRCPDRAFVLEEGGELKGFVLARDGRLATQIGPLSADSETTAAALLSAALSSGQGPVFLDAANHQSGLAVYLRDAGFVEQRGYVRMLLGQDRPLDDPSRVYLIAGPELG